MAMEPLYPQSPSGVPGDLTKPSTSYKKHAWLAMLGLLVFMAIYLALTGCFAYISYLGIMAFRNGHIDIIQMIITFSALLLTLFLTKSLFAVRKAGEPGGIEVTADHEPELFRFLRTLSDEVGAPRPHRVFITPDVNAAVFYDLSLINLIFPSKKNLIVGLGLVNVLSLGELKAVLAHEFGHFAQGSMMVGRWVYIAQQIIGHMVVVRGWLDKLVRFISRIDIRIAPLGWLLGLIIWSIRSMSDTLFSLVIMAERALSREMEFQADLVAVSVTGSDALINALYKLQAADHAWQTALKVAQSEAGRGRRLDDLFAAQRATVAEMRRVLDDSQYGEVPVIPEDQQGENHRLFTEETARPPQMWATHPANSDREQNAKSRYIKAPVDNRSAWSVFADPVALRKAISHSFYNSEKVEELESVAPLEAVIQRFNRPSYSPHFRGTYLNRSPVRNFASVEEIFATPLVEGTASDALGQLYPEALASDLKSARNLDIEKATLEALARGDLKPSGGVIRHRGDELKKEEVPDAIEEINAERREVAERLMLHDASCRQAHLLVAEELGMGWKEYLLHLIHLLHCAEHMAAMVADEHALFVNTWQVITADGQIGYFEKRRMLKVCERIQSGMREVSSVLLQIQLPASVADAMGVENWQEQSPRFEIPDVTNKNWGEWCQHASGLMNQMENALDFMQGVVLEEMISTEEMLKQHLQEGSQPEDAPACGQCPQEYPVLLPGDENELQRKLDLWNRFQLAHGFGPALARLIVSLGIVGGTVYGGLSVI